jgi:hypothetical protein
VELDMHEATQKALARFNVIKNPKKCTLAPNIFVHPTYEKGRQQQTDILDSSPALDASGVKKLQSIIGSFQYIAQCVDCTQLVKLGQLASEQSKATAETQEKANHFLQYVASWSAATIIFRPSDMQLKITSDAGYLSEPNAGSRAGGHYHLGKKKDSNFVNGPFHILCKRLDVVVASAGEAEYGGVYENGKEGEQFRRTLEDLGHPQDATPIETDNQFAYSLANDLVKQRRSKAIDMRYHWIRDRIRQGHFIIHWKPGKDNLADFFTKLHPPKYHREKRALYVSDIPKNKRTTNIEEQTVIREGVLKTAGTAGTTTGKRNQAAAVNSTTYNRYAESSSNRFIILD